MWNRVSDLRMSRLGDSSHGVVPSSPCTDEDNLRRLLILDQDMLRQLQVQVEVHLALERDQVRRGLGVELDL
jgi:hypothetical protein